MFMTITTEDNMPNTYRFNQRVEKAKGLGLSGINRELKHYANIFKGGIPKSVKNRVQYLVQAKAELEALQHKKKVAKSLDANELETKITEYSEKDLYYEKKE